MSVKNGEFIKCKTCNHPFYASKSEILLGKKYCSFICRNSGLSIFGKQNKQIKILNGFQKKEKHPRWKGGRSVTPLGYVIILMPDHPQASVGGRYVFEHRLVMEEHIGRPLKHFEIVHHKNGIKIDNRIENLELLTKREHDRLHGKQANMEYVRRCRAQKKEKK